MSHTRNAKQVRTHKEFDGYGDGYDHDWSCDQVPRTSTAYQPVPPVGMHPGAISHFVTSLKDGRKEGVTGEVVAACFREGEIFPAEGDNRYRFLWTAPATLQTFSLIVELRQEAFDRPGPKHYAVTIYRVNMRDQP